MEQEKLFWNSHLSTNWTRNIKSRKIQSNVTLSSNWDVFVCVFVFIWIWISRSWCSSFKIQKGGNFKITFPVPYPIIYNPGHIAMPFLFKLLAQWALQKKTWIWKDLTINQNKIISAVLSYIWCEYFFFWLDSNGSLNFINLALMSKQFRGRHKLKGRDSSVLMGEMANYWKIGKLQFIYFLEVTSIFYTLKFMTRKWSFFNSWDQISEKIP